MTSEALQAQDLKPSPQSLQHDQNSVSIKLFRKFMHRFTKFKYMCHDLSETIGLI